MYIQPADLSGQVCRVWCFSICGHIVYQFCGQPNRFAIPFGLHNEFHWSVQLLLFVCVHTKFISWTAASEPPDGWFIEDDVVLSYA